MKAKVEIWEMKSGWAPTAEVKVKSRKDRRSKRKKALGIPSWWGLAILGFSLEPVSYLGDLFSLRCLWGFPTRSYMFRPLTSPCHFTSRRWNSWPEAVKWEQPGPSCCRRGILAWLRRAPWLWCRAQGGQGSWGLHGVGACLSPCCSPCVFKGNLPLQTEPQKSIYITAVVLLSTHQKPSKEQPVASERRSWYVVASVPPGFSSWAALTQSLLLAWWVSVGLLISVNSSDHAKPPHSWMHCVILDHIYIPPAACAYI